MSDLPPEALRRAGTARADKCPRLVGGILTLGATFRCYTRTLPQPPTPFPDGGGPAAGERGGGLGMSRRCSDERENSHGQAVGIPFPGPRLTLDGYFSNDVKAKAKT